METLTHLDTHVLLWLYRGERRRLRPAAKFLRKTRLVASPAAILELQLLAETGRLTHRVKEVVETLASDFGVIVSGLPFPAVMERALELSWTRDPFDRLIVANAMAEGAQLLTADATIRSRWKGALWG